MQDSPDPAYNKAQARRHALMPHPRPLANPRCAGMTEQQIVYDYPEPTGLSKIPYSAIWTFEQVDAGDMSRLRVRVSKTGDQPAREILVRK